MKPLRLRCLRCGDLDEMGPLTHSWPLCPRCFYGRPLVSDAARYRRWLRWQKGMESHPTYLALSAALDALEAVPPGTLVEVDHG